VKLRGSARIWLVYGTEIGCEAEGVSQSWWTVMLWLVILEALMRATLPLLKKKSWCRRMKSKKCGGEKKSVRSK
jgi:hypothetical protein